MRLGFVLLNQKPGDGQWGGHIQHRQKEEFKIAPSLGKVMSTVFFLMRRLLFFSTPLQQGKINVDLLHYNEDIFGQFLAIKKSGNLFSNIMPDHM